MTETVKARKRVYEARYEDGVARVYRYSEVYDEEHKVADFTFGIDAKGYCRDQNAKLPNGGKLKPRVDRAPELVVTPEEEPQP